MDPLERIIRPIVEGQIRGFIKEHPSILGGVIWFKPRSDDKATTLVNSLAKRIVRDLTCRNTTARLAAALLQPASDEPPNDDAGTITGASAAGPGICAGVGGNATLM